MCFMMVGRGTIWMGLFGANCAKSGATASIISAMGRARARMESYFRA